MSILVIGGMTVDDIVLADGNMHRRVAGGNALYCALGARLWGVRSEVISCVGTDYSAAVLHQLAAEGIGTDLVATLGTTSIHLWILYEQDGRRQIHLQHGSPTLAMMENSLTAALDDRLNSGAPVAAAHVAALPVHVQRKAASMVATAGIPFTLDSLEARGSVGGDLLDYLVGPDLRPQVFLPSREEFSLLFGDTDSPAFRQWMEATQTMTLVIKDGAEGSLVFSPPAAPGVRVPAFEGTVVVDPTGAGDAYCGGFVAGMSLGRPCLESAVMGTVSASFVVEQVGARGLLDATREEAQRRLAVMLTHVNRRQ